MQITVKLSYCVRNFINIIIKTSVASPSGKIKMVAKLLKRVGGPLM